MSDGRLGLSAEEIQRFEEHGVGIGDVLAEARLFTTVSGILFGFLLTASVADTSQLPGIIQRILLLLALVCTASATLMFILPPLYHHLRFPMDQKQRAQFFWRSHKFLVWGIVPLYAGVYFSVFLALYSLIGAYAVILATGILIVPFIAYELRKVGDPKELG
ncbi:MAG: DUF6328 family protein [Halobacteriota archaeon]